MAYTAQKSQADFVVYTDKTGKEVLKTSRSTVLTPKIRWNGVGIKWLEEKVKEWQEKDFLLMIQSNLIKMN